MFGTSDIVELNSIKRQKISIIIALRRFSAYRDEKKSYKMLSKLIEFWMNVEFFNGV